ncbi:MAG: twin-arginine translocase subunit TatC [Chloroflexi bacterium]|nr:twin-arginine translocase subunit TatC [Chloroflexota bacterium]
MSSDANKLSLLGHIGELRNRLIRSVIVVVIAIIISFVFYKQLFDILLLPAPGINLIYTDMTEMIGTTMRVSLTAGIILAMPYLTYEFIGFVAPALTPKEKRYVFLVLPWITLMFIAGVAFTYFFMLPPMLKFLLTFGTEIATPQIKIGNYIAVVTRLLLAFGLIFEAPVVTTFLARLGVLNPNWLAGKRKLAVVGAFLISAIITPTVDPINQAIVGIPLILLYELSIWLGRLVYRKKRAA